MCSFSSQKPGVEKNSASLISRLGLTPTSASISRAAHPSGLSAISIRPAGISRVVRRMGYRYWLTSATLPSAKSGSPPAPPGWRTTSLAYSKPESSRNRSRSTSKIGPVKMRCLAIKWCDNVEAFHCDCRPPDSISSIRTPSSRAHSNTAALVQQGFERGGRRHLGYRSTPRSGRCQKRSEYGAN